MKKILVIGLIAVLGVIGLHTTFSSGSMISFASKSVNETKQFQAADVRSIVVNSGSADVKIARGHSSVITVALSGKASRSLLSTLDLKAELSEDTLVVEPVIENRFGFGFPIRDIDVMIELPEQDWDRIDVRAASGDVEFHELRAKEVAVKTGSGDISGSRFQAESATMRTGSGDIELTDGQGRLMGETGSGDIEISSNSMTSDASLQTGSGDVDIRLDRQPESLGFHFVTGSGEFTVDWPYTASGSGNKRELAGSFGRGDVKLEVKTGSGDITLLRR